MAEKLTDLQAARVAELEGDGCPHVYTYSYQGKSVVGAFCRYLETDDPTKISFSLRNFLMMVCGFVAHYDLNGFRSTYPFAHLLLEEMSRYSGEMASLLSGRREPGRVYRDGMTDGDICKELAELVEKNQAGAERRYAATVGQRIASEVMDGARILGWVIVPQGFVAVPLDSASHDGESCQADQALQQMAESRGLSLVPYAVAKP